MHLKLLIPTLLAIGTFSEAAFSEPVRPVLPLTSELAVKAAVAALGTCGNEGYRVTVTIVDREGVTRVQLVGDGASTISISTSRHKAYTAAALGISSAAYGKLVATYTGPTIDPELFPFAGGLPIIRQGAVVGAIGVGGADRPDKDEACAQAGLVAVQNMTS